MRRKAEMKSMGNYKKKCKMSSLAIVFLMLGIFFTLLGVATCVAWGFIEVLSSEVFDPVPLLSVLSIISLVGVCVSFVIMGAILIC